MMQEAPELTKDLQEFIKNNCPTIIWYLTTKADFPSDAKPPFSAELAAQSGVKAAKRHLANTITHKSKIINIGHLSGHVDTKTEKLK